jgi:hypothetical protein
MQRLSNPPQPLQARSPGDGGQLPPNLRDSSGTARPPRRVCQALAPCPAHPTMLLPIVAREAERILCPICCQDRRRATYAAQLAAAATTLAPPTPHHPRACSGWPRGDGPKLESLGVPPAGDGPHETTTEQGIYTHGIAAKQRQHETA